MRCAIPTVVVCVGIGTSCGGWRQTGRGGAGTSGLRGAPRKIDACGAKKGRCGHRRRPPKTGACGARKGECR